MTTRVYLDTSALIKEFVEEKGSDVVDKLGLAAKEGSVSLNANRSLISSAAFTGPVSLLEI